MNPIITLAVSFFGLVALAPILYSNGWERIIAVVILMIVTFLTYHSNGQFLGAVGVLFLVANVVREWDKKPSGRKTK